MVCLLQPRVEMSTRSTRADWWGGICVQLTAAAYTAALGTSKGSYFSWKAAAIGKNMVNAKTFLEKRWVYTHGGPDVPELSGASHQAR